MAVTALKLLQVFLLILGGLVLVWGIYDMFGEGGNQSSVGVKKIVGGIAFMVISFFLMTWAVGQVEQAEADAGFTDTAYHSAGQGEKRNPVPLFLTPDEGGEGSPCGI